VSGIAVADLPVRGIVDVAAHIVKTHES
jgi:hypothetical protein